MTARATRQISQPDSPPRARGRTGPALHYSFKNNVAQQCYRLRSSTRATTPRATLRQQVAACLNKKNRSPRDCHRLRCFTRASTAARLHPQPKSERPVGAQPHRLRSPTRASSAARLHAWPKSEGPVGAEPNRLRTLTRAISSGQNPAQRGAKLIHGSAIKTSGKRPRISKLRNSNRR